MKYSFAASVLLAGAAMAVPMAQQDQNPAASATGALPAAATTLLGVENATPNVAATPDIVATLLGANSTVDRAAKLSGEIAANKASIKFDFNPKANPGVTPGTGGAVFVANRINFPAVTGNGISGATLFFAPCGLNTPHTHPRASEWLTVVTNSSIASGYVLENGFLAPQKTTLTQYQGMVFPQGSIHWQQNLDCEPAVAAAALSSDDPGASSMAQAFLVNVDADIVDATLGFPDQITPDNFAQFKSQIPRPFVAGVEECYKRCGFRV